MWQHTGLNLIWQGHTPHALLHLPFSPNPHSSKACIAFLALQKAAKLTCTQEGGHDRPFCSILRQLNIMNFSQGCHSGRVHDKFDLHVAVDRFSHENQPEAHVLSSIRIQHGQACHIRNVGRKVTSESAPQCQFVILTCPKLACQQLCNTISLSSSNFYPLELS